MGQNRGKKTRLFCTYHTQNRLGTVNPRQTRVALSCESCMRSRMGGLRACGTSTQSKGAAGYRSCTQKPKGVWNRVVLTGLRASWEQCRDRDSVRPLPSRRFLFSCLCHVTAAPLLDRHQLEQVSGSITEREGKCVWVGLCCAMLQWGCEPEVSVLCHLADCDSHAEW